MMDRKVVVVNQAVNYLTVGICNSFREKIQDVTLITGSIHEQGEKLNENINIEWINRWDKSSSRHKLVSYLAACWRIYWRLLFRYRDHEVFFVSLPPMAYLLSVFLPQRCSVLVWDVYPDLLKITGMKESHPIYRFWGWLNRKAFRKAHRIFTIGNRMADLLSAYVSREKIIVSPIWSIFQSNGKVEKSENPFIREHSLNGAFIVQYSGNIGLTHNVEAMVDLAEMMRDKENIHFQIIGKGSRVPHLKKMVESKNLKNCQFLPFQSDQMFPFSLSAADMGVVILDETTSKGSVPSKCYNLMSYGIPSIYIAANDSELNDYSKKFGNAECFTKNELDLAAGYIEKLSRNREAYDVYSQNALNAARNFRRSNADRLVKRYLIE
jgi:hypothetical protein